MKKQITLDDIITEKDIENYNKKKSVQKQEEYIYVKDKEDYFTQIAKSKLTDEYTVITKEEYEENVYIKQKRELIRKFINDKLKDKCLDFLQQKISSNAAIDLTERIKEAFKIAHKNKLIKKQRLPRKLKKWIKNNKKVVINFTIEPTEEEINELGFNNNNRKETKNNE